MKILVFAEQRENKFKKPAFEAVRTARSIADQTNGEVVAIVVGGNVNLEVDILAKYVESLLVKRSDLKKSHLSEEYLKEQGY